MTDACGMTGHQVKQAICNTAVQQADHQSQFVVLVHDFDCEIIQHADDLIALIRRIPGLPDADRLVSAAVGAGFQPGATQAKSPFSTPLKADTRVSVAFRALQKLIVGLRNSDKSRWPGSTGCAALNLSIAAIKATIYKRYLQFVQLLSEDAVRSQDLPITLFDSVNKRLHRSRRLISCTEDNKESYELLIKLGAQIEEMPARKTVPKATPRLVPKYWQPPAPAKDAWENLLLSVEEVNAEDDGLWAKVRWKALNDDNVHQCSKHPIQHLHLAAPQKLLMYYQKFIIFSRE